MDFRLGVVLCGGAGRRMGGPKGALLVDGRPLAERAAATLASLCGRVVVSIAPGSANPVPGFAAVEDPPPAGRGPLAGILAAFAAGEGDGLVVLACDYPNVGAEWLRGLLARAEPADDVVLPVDADGRDHPLVAWWGRTMERAVREALDADRRAVRDLLAGRAVRRVAASSVEGHERRTLLNLNRPGDLAPSS